MESRDFLESEYWAKTNVCRRNSKKPKKKQPKTSTISINQSIIVFDNNNTKI